MKKTISVGLMIVLFAMPCMAQTEVEPDSAFSIHSTLWRVGQDGLTYLGFYNGSIWGGYYLGNYGYTIIPSSYYFDLVFLSVFFINTFDIPVVGLLFPMQGFGFSFYVGDVIEMQKVMDFWYPSLIPSPNKKKEGISWER